MSPTAIFLKAVDKLALAICITDTDAKILYANDAFTRLTGYSHAEVMGRCRDLVP
ncbi:MAG: PAS domain S-box protein [Candidatus Competibacteraceae bacterium]